MECGQERDQRQIMPQWGRIKVFLTRLRSLRSLRPRGGIIIACVKVNYVVTGEYSLCIPEKSSIWSNWDREVVSRKMLVGPPVGIELGTAVYWLKMTWP